MDGMPSINELNADHLLFEKNRKTIQDSIDKCVGQLVIVQVDRDVLAGCTGFGGHGYVTTQTDLSIGIISGKTEYNTDMLTKIVVPVSARVDFNEFDRRWEKSPEDPIEMGLGAIYGLGKVPPLRAFGEPAHNANFSISLDVVAGDLDVAAHFNIGCCVPQAEYKLLREARSEGRLTDGDLKQRISEAKDVKWEYLLVTNMLGVKVLPELEGHAAKLKEGIVRAVYEGRDTKENLDRALQLGMHKTPGTVEIEGEGIRTIINVHEYITKKCKTCKVEIP